MSLKLDEIQVGVAEVVDYTRITGGFEEALKEVVKRKVTVEAAKQKGFQVSDEDLQRAADVFRTVNKLYTMEETEQWLKGKGLTIESLEDYLEANLLIAQFKEDLEKSVDQEKYRNSPVIKESLKELAYQDWFANVIG